MKKILFNDGWAMKKASGTMVDFGKYEPVTVPHDAAIGQPRAASCPSGAATGYAVNGVYDYKKLFEVPLEWKGNRVLVEFEGVYANAEVKVNNNFVYHRPNGYSTFFVDITDYLKFGAKNKLLVRANNSSPLDSRWYTGAGIYRNVWLHIKEPICFKPWGIQITTEKADADHATVKLKAIGRNNTSALQKMTLQTTLTFRGQEADKCTYDFTADPESDFTVEQNFDIEHPAIWDAASPNLYEASIRLLCGSDVMDDTDQTFGIRTIDLDVNQGLLLNGKPIKLKGGCVHHDNGILGAASYPRAEKRKIELLKQAGYNAIRTAHNPPSPCMLDACDQLGMLVMDEAFDMWRAGKNANDYHLYFEKWWQEDLAAMILRDYNHPSVILWSVGNEILERDGSSDGDKWSKIIADYAHDLDSTRPITQGIIAVPNSFDEWEDKLLSNWDLNTATIKDDPDNVWGKKTEKFVAPLDVVGYNYMPFRYKQDVIDYPDRIILGTESYPGEMYTMWQETWAHPRVIGDFSWTPLDYLGEAGIGQYTVDAPPAFAGEFPWLVSGCGDMDICGFKKPQSYYRDILWGVRKRPYIGVLPPWLSGHKISLNKWGWAPIQECWTFPGYEGQMVAVHVYSADDEIELFLNGQSVARQELVANQTVFEVPYQPGSVEARAYKNGVLVNQFALLTTGPAVALSLDADASSIQADNDLCFLSITAVDENGNHVIASENSLSISVSNGDLIALGNGCPKTEELYTDNTHSLYEGRALAVVRSNGKEGTISVVVKPDNLPTDTIEIYAQKTNY